MKKNNNHIKNEKSVEKLILESSSKLIVPSAKNKDLVWDELNDKLNYIDNLSTYRKNSFHLIYKVVAAAVIVFSISITFFLSGSNLSTEIAETKEVYLPDSSYVFLQPDSKISFNKGNWSSKRELNLEGEAFFSVKKGSSFSVITSNGVIKVLGTKFNVINRNKNFEVGCASGKVRVSLKNQTGSIILTKGLLTQKTQSGNLSAPLVINTNQIINRKNGEFYFERALLQIVFEEFERQFNVKVKYNGVEKSRKFTGYFMNKDLETSLMMICKPMNLDYQIDSKVVIIRDLAKPTK